MTYCVGMRLNDGLVFLSDSRTNAGVDQISTYRKMTVFEHPGERLMVLLSAGNLAIVHPDLTVASVTAPLNAVSADTIDVGWHVKNVGTAQASADWVDRVYLSLDTTVSSGDRLLGSVTHTDERAIPQLTADLDSALTKQVRAMLPGLEHRREDIFGPAAGLAASAG